MEEGGKTAQHRKKALPTTTRTPITLLPETTPEKSSTMGPLTISMPCHPPPLIHYMPQSLSPLSEPFVLCFITGNIGVCYGCWQKYPKPCEPPHDLCVLHKEWREFFPPGSGTAQTRFGNVYYHCNVPCIQARCPFFSSNMLQIPAFIAAQLLPIHTEYLLFICAILWKVMCRVYTVYFHVLLVVLNDTLVFSCSLGIKI